VPSHRRLEVIIEVYPMTERKPIVLDTANVPSYVAVKDGHGLNMSLLGLFGIGPKWTLTCGSCATSFRARIPMVDRPGVRCPHCGVVNVLSLKWSRLGERDERAGV